MKRFTFIVSGNVHKAGYRDRVIELGKFVNLKGYAENLPDGRVRIIEEGEEDQLEFYREHINIKNTLINVENIEYTESEATGEFYGFLKLVSNDETDARLDTAANILKDVIINMNRGFDKLNNSMETGFNKVITTLIYRQKIFIITICVHAAKERAVNQEQWWKKWYVVIICGQGARPFV